MKESRAPIAENAAATVCNADCTGAMQADQEPLTAVWPNPKSLEGRLLARLLAGESFTSREWLAAARSMRLPDAVFKLRVRKWIVQGERLTVPTADRTADGVRTANIARYFLDAAQRVRALALPESAKFIKQVAEHERRVGQ